MARNGDFFLFRILIVAVVLASLLVAPSAGFAAETVVSGCGLTFILHTSGDVDTELTVEFGGRRFLKHSSVGRIEVLFGVDDPRQARSGVEAFHPLDLEAIKRAIEAIDGFSADVTVDVFILSTPPVEPQSSFSTGRAIVLAPGYGPVDETTVAYLLAHELGHVMTVARVDPAPQRWARYLALRGLDARDDGPSVPHAERNREVFAEDFRFLFGGTLAACSGGIENPGLAMPDQVVGLRRMLAEFFAEAPVTANEPLIATAFPNPCNPMTTIEMQLPAGADGDAAARLNIYDLSGRLLRTQDARAQGGRVAFQWRGVDDGNRAVASGRYLYTVRCGVSHGRGSVLLVR